VQCQAGPEARSIKTGMPMNTSTPVSCLPFVLFYSLEGSCEKIGRSDFNPRYLFREPKTPRIPRISQIFQISFNL
jgi:hypothetical protein